MVSLSRCHSERSVGGKMGGAQSKNPVEECATSFAGNGIGRFAAAEGIPFPYLTRLHGIFRLRSSPPSPPGSTLRMTRKLRCYSHRSEATPTTPPLHFPQTSYIILAASLQMSGRVRRFVPQNPRKIGGARTNYNETYEAYARSGICNPSGRRKQCIIAPSRLTIY